MLFIEYPKCSTCLEYFSYEMMNKHVVVMDAFEKCAKEHLNSSEVRGRIYKKGLSLAEFSNALEEVVWPVYQLAKNCGFRNWVYTGGSTVIGGETIV